MTLEEEFTSRCFQASDILRTRYRYNAARFNQMLGERGGVATTRHLIGMVGQSDGYSFLYQEKRLDLSAEALALLPEYQSLFTPAELRLARDTLIQSQFPVLDFLERATKEAPPWWDGLR